MFGSVRKLKQGAVPSLLLPDESISSDEGDCIEEIYAVEKENPIHRVNVTPSTSDFSPISYCSCVLKSPGSASLRRSSLLVAAESGDLISTPKSSRTKLAEVFLSRKADDVTLESFKNENTLSGPSSGIHSEEIEAEGINSGGIGAESVTRNENEETGDTSQKKDISTSSKGLKSRASKRLVWRKKSRDNFHF